MSKHKLIKAYDDFMNHLNEAMDETLHNLADALLHAKEKASSLGGHTQEEINRIADYVSRDVKHNAATSPNADYDSFSQWLKFDLKLLENFAVDTFLSLADKTRVKLTELEMDASLYHPYHSGDVASPGAFVCDHCGKQIAFKSTSVIPQCPECHTESFSRL
jgi:hypothetical protein